MSYALTHVSLQLALSVPATSPLSCDALQAVRQATTQRCEVLLQHMSPASISHKDEEVGMGRTKHRLPPRNKSEREFNHEVGNIVFVLNAIDAGRLDHLFVDAETKAAVRADWMAKWEAVVRKYVRAYPGMFYETPDGKIGELPEGANITPLRRPEDPGR
jgi:hypothetical protein